MARGKVVLHVMPVDYVQNGHGHADFVSKLPSLLRRKLGAGPLPKYATTDKGPGLYQASSGTIVVAYRDALAAHGFKPFAGEEAKWQPPDIPDVLLHETVASCSSGPSGSRGSCCEAERPGDKEVHMSTKRQQRTRQQSNKKKQNSRLSWTDLPHAISQRGICQQHWLVRT